MVYKYKVVKSARMNNALRSQVKDGGKKNGVRLSYHHFFFLTPAADLLFNESTQNIEFFFSPLSVTCIHTFTRFRNTYRLHNTYR